MPYLDAPPQLSQRLARALIVVASFLPVFISCSIPVKRRLPFEPIGLRLTAIDVSPSHACGITREREAFCWGTSSNGQLGNGATEYVSGVVRVTGAHRFTSIGTSFTRTCALTTAGDTYCWGMNPAGVPTRSLKALEESSRAEPVRVADGLQLAHIGVGQWHTCGLTPDGRAYCWGRGGMGLLGNPADSSSPAPVPVVGRQTFSMIAVGDSHTCALTSAGEAYCWGDGGDGRLGHGKREGSAIPVQVAGGLRFRSISAGERHTCAIATSDAVYCWGLNADMRLGTATTEYCGSYPCGTSPIAVPARHRFTAISAGKERTCALTSAGELVCWGDTRPRSRRGPGTTNAAAPMLVLRGHTFSALSVSSNKACGLAANSQAYCWNTLVGLPLEPHRVPPPRFLTFALIGALLGGLLGYVGYRVVPDRYALGSVLSGAGTGAFIGFFIGAALGFKDFMDALPW